MNEVLRCKLMAVNCVKQTKTKQVRNKYRNTNMRVCQIKW